jgi:catalase (peroxidase I)
MKRALMAASLVALFTGAHAFAQTVGVGPAETVVIEPEQRTLIREYVVKEKVSPVTVKERISVGATLPVDIELRSAPAAWGPKLSKYRYVYSDNHVYLVEPSNRTVVQIIE